MSSPKRLFRQLAIALRHRFLFQAYVVSYPKCGRTWLNAIFLHYVLRIYAGIESPLPFEWAPSMSRHTWYRRFPNICFTHDVVGAAKTVEEIHHAFDPLRYLKKPTVFLVRDPRDVEVSYYYHAIKKTFKNQLPADITLHTFLHHERYGLRAVIAYYNLWAPLIRSQAHVHFVKYEALRSEPVSTTEKVLRWLGVERIQKEALVWAVEQTAFERLQRREAAKLPLREGEVDPNRLRVRRGVIGGYRDEFEEGDLAFADQVIKQELDGIYGYA